MRDLFRGYYQPTTEEVKKIWDNGLTVLDANVLLSLYKVSPATSSFYLKSLEQRAAKNWLPFQVAMEFHNNVHRIRREQTAGHSKRIKDVEAFRNVLRNTENKSRLQESELQTQIDPLLEELIKELNAELAGIKDQTHHNKPDQLLTRISELFAGRVGAKPSNEALSKLFDRGKVRYDSETPPGYEDRKTKANGDEFGDYVFWQQVMDHAQTEKMDVVLVTDDNKADWWLKIGGEAVAPRPELIQEFREFTGQNIIIWNSKKFYRHLTNQSTDTGTPAEVKAAADDMQSAVMRAQVQKMTEDLAEQRWISQLSELAKSDMTAQPESSDGLLWLKTSDKMQKFLADKTRDLMSNRSDAWPTTDPADRELASEVLELIKLRNNLMRSMKEVQFGLDESTSSSVERALVQELDLLASDLEEVDKRLSDAQMRRRLRGGDE